MTKISTALPAELAAAIAKLMENRPRKALQASARRLSDNFRARKPTIDTVRDETDALAYALTRLPATYAATATVLGNIREEDKGFAPRKILDLACGLGAGAFAAIETWPDIESVTLLDRSAEFLAFGREFARSSGRAALANANVVEADLTFLPQDNPYDLVVVGYALTEIPDAFFARAIEGIWARTGSTLALIEPGTPRDYQRLMAARTRLVALGATILAPCPHPQPCPLLEPDWRHFAAPDWCHFSARLPRSRDHKLLKDAQAPFEDEKFSYLVLRRGGAAAPARGRVIGPPRMRKHGIELKLCARKGICETFVPKRDKARYDRIRKSFWGDSVAAPAEDDL